KKLLALVFLAWAASLRAGNLDTIGVTVLRQVDPTLTGTGVQVAQPEAGYNLGTNWEVNPGAVGQPVSLFTYTSADGSTNSFPNSLSSESGHADGVAGNFYGIPSGVATNIAHVDNYDADYFYNSIVATNVINDPVVNQSFIFCNADYSHLAVSDEELVDSQYDDYAALYNTLFISGAGNGGPTNQAQVYPAATCYNGLGVAAFGGSSCIGPTLDNGRCKPDITAPAGVTSFSTPLVAGAAAILVQAASRGDGGADTNAANDLRTIKALLLNGAIKPNGWTNGTASPLDARYGAGVVNVFNSWEQLKGGRHAFIESASFSSGGAHPPGANTNNEPTLIGWDYNTISTSPTQDTVNHYYFNLPGGNAFTLTATLVWNKQYQANSINNLNLFLYNAANSNLVACSTSLVDNVQHIFLPTLPAGRYDLQVLKSGSVAQVSQSETNALAFEVFNMPLSVGLTNSNVVISWPVAPTGFQLQSATSLAPPVSWVSVTNAVSIANNENVVTLPLGGGNQFFRLTLPAF
ncbi:MAG TPA: S8 family serine peptidase, partial [Verrucomicrobiae bacterium]|nr:S8 family serine peptidase [Verrucomicrobiae bacterium]